MTRSAHATPGHAVEAGSSYLVIGRPITRAADPVAALATDQSMKLQCLEGYRSMKITVIGSAMWASFRAHASPILGNDVLCLDLDEKKIDMLKRGEHSDL